ncbi:MAG: hypothetical protein PHQ41_07785 [Candidatus Cloacimonetes bacterium]|nr:hypothetical protein [Candidatus Cloacimonadota bacterium]
MRQNAAAAKSPRQGDTIVTEDSDPPNSIARSIGMLGARLRSIGMLRYERGTSPPGSNSFLFGLKRPQAVSKLFCCRRHGIKLAWVMARDRRNRRGWMM